MPQFPDFMKRHLVSQDFALYNLPASILQLTAIFPLILPFYFLILLAITP